MKRTLMHGSDWIGQDLAGWIVTEKFDGYRAYWDGRRLWTRGGCRYPAPPWFTAGLPDMPLDCELFAGYGNRETLAACMNSPAAFAGKGLMVFDSPTTPGGYSERSAAIGALSLPAHVKAVSSWACPGVDGLKAHLLTLKAAGGEGFVVHKPGAPYTPGRVQTVLKFKE
jgi:DNA ligase-1